MNNLAETKKNIKKCESNITITGLGVLVFGMWSVLKFIIQTINGVDVSAQLAELDVESHEDKLFIMLFTIIFLAIIAFAILLFHSYVGIKAIGYGRGVSRKRGFLIPAGVMAVLNVVSVIMYFRPKDGTINFDDTRIAALLVDITLCYILFDMIFSAIRLGILKKQMLQEQ
jgi:hypothetical protein